MQCRPCARRWRIGRAIGYRSPGRGRSTGTALLTLGERESGTAHLEEAVASFRLSLEEYPRNRVPLEWAATQNGLGGALESLGDRESGTARLEEAVAAFRLALEECPRDREPLRWAKTQRDLGDTLLMLGERESGTAHLDEAVAAFDVCRDRLASRMAAASAVGA
jgi:tetratricopeptide (TPR) repeat protein